MQSERKEKEMPKKTVHILGFPLIVVCSLFMSDIAKSKFPQ